MADYKILYYMLFNEITDIIEALKAVQIKVEEEFLRSEERENVRIILLDRDGCV